MPDLIFYQITPPIPISGDVTIDPNTVTAISGVVSAHIVDLPNPIGVSGTLNTSVSIPQPLAVSGTVSANIIGTVPVSFDQPIAISGSITSIVAVSGIVVDIATPLAVSGTVFVQGVDGGTPVSISSVASHNSFGTVTLTTSGQSVAISVSGGATLTFQLTGPLTAGEVFTTCSVGGSGEDGLPFNLVYDNYFYINEIAPPVYYSGVIGQAAVAGLDTVIFKTDSGFVGAITINYQVSPLTNSSYIEGNVTIGSSYTPLSDSQTNSPYLTLAYSQPTLGTSKAISDLSYPLVFNGTTWDRTRSANDATGTPGVGLAGAGILGYDSNLSSWQKVGMAPINVGNLSIFGASEALLTDSSIFGLRFGTVPTAVNVTVLPGDNIQTSDTWLMTGALGLAYDTNDTSPQSPFPMLRTANAASGTTGTGLAGAGMLGYDGQHWQPVKISNSALVVSGTVNQGAPNAGSANSWPILPYAYDPVQASWNPIQAWRPGEMNGTQAAGNAHLWGTNAVAHGYQVDSAQVKPIGCYYGPSLDAITFRSGNDMPLQTASFTILTRGYDPALGDYRNEPKRDPIIFKTASATASGSTTLWTPTSSKKFRLMRFKVQVTANCYIAARGLLTIKLLDSATDLNLTHDVYLGQTPLGADTNPQALPILDTAWIDLGNGILSSTADNVLKINLSTALLAGVVRIICCGTEE